MTPSNLDASFPSAMSIRMKSKKVKHQILNSTLNVFKANISLDSGGTLSDLLVTLKDKYGNHIGSIPTEY